MLIGCRGVQGRLRVVGMSGIWYPVAGTEGTTACRILTALNVAATVKPARNSARRLFCGPKLDQSLAVRASGMVNNGNETFSWRIHCRCTRLTIEKMPINRAIKNRLQKKSGTSHTPQGMAPLR